MNAALKEKKLFLFDIDGTLALGDTLFDGSRELLRYIDSIGGKSYFITNNSTKSGADYVTRFRNVFGLETREAQFITAGYLTKKYLHTHYEGKKIYCQGTRSFVDDLLADGLMVCTTADADIACILVAYDNEVTYAKLMETSKALLTTQVPFYGTNSDLRCPYDFGFIPDCGAICNLLRDTTDRVPTYLGKPNPEMVTLCLEASGFSPAETLVVGDRLYTDIACGINAGVDTCVLFTGEATPRDLETTEFSPTYQFDTVSDLLSALM